MSELTLPIEATEDASTGIEPTVSNESPPQPPTLVTEQQSPVLITEQQVMFGTAAVVRPRPTSIASRVVGALRDVAAALAPPPPRRRYAARASYLESACMSREMDRL
jgi:hypothetical protein